MWVEGDGIVDGGDAEEAKAEEESGPDKPAVPEEIAEGNEGDREKESGKTVEAGVDGAEDVAAVELPGWEEIQRGGEQADPGGAAYRGKQENVWVNPGMKDGVEEAE